MRLSIISMVDSVYLLYLYASNTDVFVIPFPCTERLTCTKQVAQSIPKNDRYAAEAAFNSTKFFYLIPAQLFTEKSTLADSRTTQGGSTITLFIKKRLLRHPRMHSHVYRQLVLAARTGVHSPYVFLYQRQREDID